MVKGYCSLYQAQALRYHLNLYFDILTLSLLTPNYYLLFSLLASSLCVCLAVSLYGMFVFLAWFGFFLCICPCFSVCVLFFFPFFLLPLRPYHFFLCFVFFFRALYYCTLIFSSFMQFSFLFFSFLVLYFPCSINNHKLDCPAIEGSVIITKIVSCLISKLPRYSTYENYFLKVKRCILIG